jgi:hypothetical protein
MDSNENTPVDQNTTPTIFQMPNLDRAPEELMQLLMHNYQWFDEKHKQEVQPFIEGCLEVSKRALPLQIRVYSRTITAILAKDLKDRTIEFVSNHLGYMEAPYSDNPKLAPVERLQLITESHVHFRPIEDLTDMIPLQILRKLTILEEAGIIPQQFLIGTFSSTYPTDLTKVRMLCARFDSWFIPIGDWIIED